MRHNIITLVVCGVLCVQGIAGEETTQSRPSQSRSADSRLEERPQQGSSVKTKISTWRVAVLGSITVVIGFGFMALRKFLPKPESTPLDDLLDSQVPASVPESVLLPVVGDEKNSTDAQLDKSEDSDEESDLVPPDYNLEESLYNEYLIYAGRASLSDQEYNNYLYKIHNPRPLPQLPEVLKPLTASDLIRIVFIPKVDQVVPSHNMQWEVKLGEKLILELIDRDQLTDLFISPAMIKVLFGEQIACWSSYVPPRGWIDLPGDNLSSPSRLRHLNIFTNFGRDPQERSQFGFKMEAMIAKQIRENPDWLKTQGSNWRQSYLWFMSGPVAAYYNVMLHTPLTYYLARNTESGNELLNKLHEFYQEYYKEPLKTVYNFDFTNAGFKNYLEVIKTLMPEMSDKSQL